jgi:2-keto-4-pentenoate hydratase/2-oxohepta-3-ene-1,7-dioic acid hydratase in catechol pathway
MASKAFRWLRVGDIVTFEVEKIGELKNPTVEESLTGAGSK